jgi:hypothetical protein
MQTKSYEKALAMRRVVRALTIGALLVVSLATLARADATYYYTGESFTSFYNPYYPSLLLPSSYACVGGVGECQLTGYVTLAQPFAPNLIAWNTEIYFGSWVGSSTPVTALFTDGVNILGSSDPLFSLTVSTNSSGEITAWDMFVQTEDIAFGSSSSPNSYGWYDTTSQIWGNGAASSDDPGVWSENASAVPESPSFIYLLLAGASWWAAWFIRSRKRLSRPETA